MPRHLLAVAEGWPAGGSTPVALERPGEDWRPVDPLVEGDVTGCLGNAAPVPPGPGRPTDTADARWRATRLRSGRRQARGLPPQGQGAWRALRRARPTRVQARRREGQWGPGVLARATIKVAAVATDLMGGLGAGELGGAAPGTSRPGDEGGAGPRPETHAAPTAGARAAGGRARPPPSGAGEPLGPSRLPRGTAGGSPGRDAPRPHRPQPRGTPTGSRRACQRGGARRGAQPAHALQPGNRGRGRPAQALACCGRRGPRGPLPRHARKGPRSAPGGAAGADTGRHRGRPRHGGQGLPQALASCPLSSARA
jgi:hypothetical protein